MKRLLPSLATLAFALSVGNGAAFAKSHHGAMHERATGAMPDHSTGYAMHHHRNHRYGNDRARCRDAHGRFMKLTNGRCLAR